MKFLLVLLLASCTNLRPGCIVQNQGSEIVSHALVMGLQCDNAGAVRGDVLAAFQKLNLCPQGEAGPLADALCPGVSQFVSEFLAQKAIPVSWQCSSSNAKRALTRAIESACRKIPFSPAE